MYRWDSVIACREGWRKASSPAGVVFWAGWSPQQLPLWSQAASSSAGLPVFSKPELRSEHAEPGAGVPPDMMVVVSSDGKLFHASGCPFIHDKAHVRTIVAREALKEGYAPCVRCMKKYLRADLSFTPLPA